MASGTRRQLASAKPANPERDVSKPQEEQIKINILKSNLNKITNGEYISKLILRCESERSTCVMTTALHLFANSLWVLWDTIKMFEIGRGCITLDSNAIYYANDWLLYKRPDGSSITSQDMFKSFGYILGFVLSNMTKSKPLEEFVKMKCQIDQSFIDNCPEINNPLTFLRFLCVMTKPITNTLNESGNIRKDPLECFLTEIRTSFECTKCNLQWEINREYRIFVDLVLLLQKEDSKFISDISSLVENNRAGIYILNLKFPIYHASLKSHQCGHEHIKRFINIIPPQYGSILFMINRYAVESCYLNSIIRPDDQMIINNMALSLTSSIFFANSHYVIALSVDEDFVVIHDDMKEQSLVLPSLETFYKNFDKFEHKNDFNFFPDESYIFAYDTSPYSSENEDWTECAEHHVRLFQEAKEISSEFILQEDSNVNTRLRDGSVQLPIQQQTLYEASPCPSPPTIDDTSRLASTNVVNPMRNVVQVNAGNVLFVNLTKDLIKRAGPLFRTSKDTVPSKGQKDKLYKMNYSKCKAIPIYKGDKPTHRDFLGLYHIQSDSARSSKHAIVHYGHPILQKQPSFYENPHSMDIWKLPGIANEYKNNVLTDLNLAGLYAGVGDMVNVCYAQDEHIRFMRKLKEKPFVIDDSTIEEPFFLVTPFWKSRQFQTTIGARDFEPRGIIGFLRSSPVYHHQYSSNIARSYFEGKFPESYESSIIDLEGLPDENTESIKSCILNDYRKPSIVPDSFRNSFIDCLLAYMHSPLQTRKARVPLKNREAQEAFDRLLLSWRLPIFFFVQKIDVVECIYPKRVLKCQVAKRGSKQHQDYYMENMDHYSGFIMPSQMFHENEMSGKVVPNGWVISGLKPWYLTEHLDEFRNLQSEAHLFNTRNFLRLGRPKSNDIISSRNQQGLKTIYSLLSLCQIAYNNISINILKEVFAHTKSDIDREPLETLIRQHKCTRDQQANPSKLEIMEVLNLFQQLPLSQTSGTFGAEVTIDTDAALKVIENGMMRVEALKYGVFERALVMKDVSHYKRKIAQESKDTLIPSKKKQKENSLQITHRETTWNLRNID